MKPSFVFTMVLLCLSPLISLGAAPGNSRETPGALPKTATRPAGRIPNDGLAPAQAKLLRRWYAAVGPRRSGEPFGKLVARSAVYQRGRRYHAPKQIDQRAGQTERLNIKLNNFDCISLIESSFALARCIWKSDPTGTCFLSEIIASRFRDGRRGDYADRLHYFSEWLRDNGRRGRVRDLAGTLGGRPFPRRMNFMSRHPDWYPALRRPRIASRIRRVEAGLTRTPATVLDRVRLRRSERFLHDGDIAAIVTNLRGILVTHAGLVVRVRRQPRLLHASRYHKGVVLDGASLAHYVNRRPERLGILAFRPLAPASSLAKRP